jgi:hypothetical protein
MFNIVTAPSAVEIITYYYGPQKSRPVCGFSERAETRNQKLLLKRRDL